MIIIISLFIGFFIGYLTASLVNAARDYEMPEIEQQDSMHGHASETKKAWAKEAPQQMINIDYHNHPGDGLASYPTNTTNW